MDPIVIATILFVLGLCFLFLDLFIPTAGVFLVVAALSAFGSILFAFRSSTNAGLIFSALVLGSIPVFVGFFLKVWPHTALGKRLLGRLPERSEYQWASAQGVQNVKSLIGCNGRTLTEMMPTGLIEIDGNEFESLTEGRTVAKGKTVKVIRVEMGRLVVAEVEGAVANRPVSKETSNPTGQAASHGSLLDQPIEELGLESLKDQES